jgi:hypothetical protein
VPGREGIAGNETANLLATDKATYIGTLCQKNKGSVEIKQRTIKMDS